MSPIRSKRQRERTKSFFLSPGAGMKKLKGEFWGSKGLE